MTQTLSAAVAANVRAECARQRVTQAELATLLNLSQAAVSRRLSGAVAFELDELHAVAERLSLQVEQLVKAAA
jgi:predicted transcriptional regulator